MFIGLIFFMSTWGSTGHWHVMFVVFFRKSNLPHLSPLPFLFAEVDERCEFRSTCGDHEADEADGKTTWELAGQFHLGAMGVQEKNSVTLSIQKTFQF